MAEQTLEALLTSHKFAVAEKDYSHEQILETTSKIKDIRTRRSTLLALSRRYGELATATTNKTIASDLFSFESRAYDLARQL